MVRFKLSTATDLPNRLVIFFNTISGITSTSNSFINRRAGQFIYDVVYKQYDQNDYQVNGVGILIPAFFIVLEQNGRQHLVGRSYQQYEQGQLSHTGNEWEQISRNNGTLLDRHDDLGQTFEPADTHDLGRFLDLGADLKHGVDTGSGCHRHVFHAADEN